MAKKYKYLCIKCGKERIGDLKTPNFICPGCRYKGEIDKRLLGAEVINITFSWRSEEEFEATKRATIESIEVRNSAGGEYDIKLGNKYLQL